MQIVKTSNEFELKLSALAEGADEIARKAVYEGARVMADAIRKAADKVISKDATGDMMASFGIGPIETNKDGIINTTVGFSGYDRRGAPNILKARALNSGTSRIKKRSFMRNGLNSSKKRAAEAMEKVISDEIEKITGR
jgi:HK97 gp10 family phage protein